MSFGLPPNQVRGPMNGVGPNQNFGGGPPALLPTPPMPVPMPTGVPPPLMPPGMLPVPIIASTAPVPLIPSSAAPLLGGTNKASLNSHSSVFVNSGSKSSYKRNQNDSGSSLSNNPEIAKTTVFVGNITEHASDTFVRQVLMKCGSIASWKRVQGVSGRLQAFGFCEYTSPEAALRCMRILNNFKLGDKMLLVKVDSKTRAQLDDYKRKKKEEHTEDKTKDGEYDVELDEETKAMDKDCLDSINELISGNSTVLGGTYDESLPYMKRSHSGCADNLDGLDMDNAKKDLVSKEIRSFRQAYRNDDEASKKEKDRDRDRERSRDRDRDKDRDRDRDRERRRDREDREREKDYERRRDRGRRRDEDNYSDEETRRSSRKASSRDTEPVERSRSSKSIDKEKNKEEEEEDEYEKRRLERVKRDKDKSYSERLKEFEARERKKMREYEKQYIKDQKRKEDEAEERIHLKEFLEDYEDDRDDVKYYRGSAFSRRMRDREMEAESDHRDKQREMEEIDEILRKRLADPSTEKENESPTPNRVKREKTPEKVQPQQPLLMKPTFSAVKTEQRSPSPEKPAVVFNSTKRSSPPAVSLKREKEQEEEVEQPSKKKTIGFGLKATAVSQPSNKKLESIFNAKEEEQLGDDSPKKKLSKIDTEDEEEKKKAASADEKKKTIRNLIEKIPTAKDELFMYPIKMDMIDQNLVDKRIKPWVNKKIFEYIGEQEPTLVEFICSKVTAKSLPKNILEDVEMVLDEEAEVFVVKMWRLLIYETEAKHLGLVK